MCRLLLTSNFKIIQLKFCRDGDNSFKCSAKTENCGTLEWHEKYTEEGAEICMKHVESGATHKEKWCRKVKMLGWFECCKMEGVEEYMKKASECCHRIDRIVHTVHR